MQGPVSGINETDPKHWFHLSQYRYAGLNIGKTADQMAAGYCRLTFIDQLTVKMLLFHTPKLPWVLLKRAIAHFEMTSYSSFNVSFGDYWASSILFQNDFCPFFH